MCPLHHEFHREDLYPVESLPVAAPAQTWQKDFDVKLQARWSFVPTINQNITYWFVLVP